MSRLFNLTVRAKRHFRALVQPSRLSKFICCHADPTCDALRNYTGNPISLRFCTFAVSVIISLATAFGTHSTVQASPLHRPDMKPDTLIEVKQAAVMVFTSASRSNKGDTPLGSGSGFFINSSGLLITNNHVVDPVHMRSDAEKQSFHYKTGRLTWTIVTNSGTDLEKTWDAMVLYQNETADQAVLQAYDTKEQPLESPHFLRLMPESRLKDRTKIWALGFPGGDRQRSSRDKHPEVSVTVGHVLQAPRTPGGRIRMIYTDVIARPGNSGGPMVDADGFVVGTVTLMNKPEDRDDGGGANYSALVPAELTGQMIRNAFDLGKMPQAIDVTPFMELLTQKNGRINLPEFRRLRDKDVLHFDDGDRIHGTIDEQTIKWKSKLANFQVPIDTIAYIMTNIEGSHLFMEGGNYLASSRAGSKFQFRPDGGRVGKHRFDSVSVMALRTAGRHVTDVIGEVVVVDSNVCHLILSDVKGTVPFKTKIGTVEIDLKDVERVDREEDQRQVLTLADGRRMTGRFEHGTYHAKIAATGTPIEFDLNGLEWAHVQRVYERFDEVAGLSLQELCHDADADLQDIAQQLRRGELDSAKEATKSIKNSPSFRRLPAKRKDFVQLLDAACALREARFDEAIRAFRKASRSKHEGVAAYASAAVAVLKRFPNKQFDGVSLSKHSAFVAAGETYARELISTVRTFLKNARQWHGDLRSEYATGIANIRKFEDQVRFAAVFSGDIADDELIRMWNLGKRLALAELSRLQREIDEIQPNKRGSNTGNRGSQLAMQRELNEIRKQQEGAAEKLTQYQQKLFEYGFRIEDPDIQAMRERRGRGR